ncbi:hypothetical protein LTR37_003769 [Vermiconidia calcicola]|uniref:Uncharacterized protein n=1 Tax=Vermiconidia calcicola TaxID=1690605 RepID=A0ACC3NP42_9PEZI|nr:hypothetical protein LTR37_003769 [Vermiconidia calcicola]
MPDFQCGIESTEQLTIGTSGENEAFVGGDLMRSPVELPRSAGDLFSPPGSSINSLRGLSDTSLGSNNGLSDLLAFTLPTPRPTTSAAPTGEVQSFKVAPATGQACSCLTQALGLMTELSELLSKACTLWTTQGIEDCTAIRTFQDVLGQNKAAVDAVGTMLHCPCTHDGSLLVIISLIVFKILGLFAAVLTAPGCSDSQAGRSFHTSASEPALQSHADERSYRIEGKNWARMSAQAVLSELHSVRRLSLSSKLKSQAAILGGEKDMSNASLESMSGEIYKQLDTDLLNRLKALSQGIIVRLRSF